MTDRAVFCDSFHKLLRRICMTMFMMVNRKRSPFMNERMLVTYATRAGSTHEVADCIANVLRENGLEADVRHVKQVNDLNGYQGVILGSAIRMGHILPEALQFAKRFQRELRGLPVIYFVVCATMGEDTPENRRIVETYLEPLCKLHPPAATKGLFAGKVDPAKLEFPWSFFLKYVKEGPMASGDRRNWDAIRAWAASLVPILHKLVPA
jgi:menaquinone-dependent protoporphyrinogen oxidase